MSNIILTNEERIEKCKEVVMDYYNENVEKTDNKNLLIDEVYIVWFSKTLDHFKALVSTDISDGMYYEVTYNGKTNQIYLDAYKKWENKCIEEVF